VFPREMTAYIFVQITNKYGESLCRDLRNSQLSLRYSLKNVNVIRRKLEDKNRNKELKEIKIHPK
jgi:hypothetical protein